MNNLTIKLDVLEVNELLEEAVRKSLAENWGMTKDVIENAVISIKINCDRDGEVTDAVVVVAPRIKLAEIAPNIGKAKK
jgi:hypothetical protein